MRPLIAAVLLTLSLGAGSAQAVTITLYDGALNSLPGSQGWAFLTSPFFGSTASQSVVASATRLVTTSATSSSQAGYFNTGHPLSPVLDRNVGYTLSVEARLNSESHSSVNRAGFSVIVLGSDELGLEVGFWTNEVWVQDDTPLFTHGEGAAFDTTADFARYDITILGSGYALAIDGTQVLAGSIRDYSAFAGFPDVYEIPNFIFLGDDTSSAFGSVDIRHVSVTLGPFAEDPPAIAMPEPAALGLLAVAPLLLRRRPSCSSRWVDARGRPRFASRKACLCMQG